MRLEHIPLILGAIVGLIGLGFIADAWMADSGAPTTERRRRMRAERSRAGEGLVGVGVLCISASLMGRDTWRYGTMAVLIGSVLVLIGIVLNRTFLKEALFFRGATRRADESSDVGSRPAKQSPKKPVSGTSSSPRPPAAPPPVMGRNRPAESSASSERRKTPRGKRE